MFLDFKRENQLLSLIIYRAVIICFFTLDLFSTYVMVSTYSILWLTWMLSCCKEIQTGIVKLKVEI